jgi:hypothetical protein
MRYPLSLFILTLLAGCGADRPNTLGEEEYKGATTASATTRVVAEDPALKRTLPEHSRILNKSADLSDASLQVERKREESPLLVGAPLVTSEELATNPAAAADSADAKANEQMAAIKLEQEQSLFSKFLSWSGWATVAGGAIWLARVLGLPGAQFLSDPIVKIIGGKKLKEAEQKSEELGQTLQHYAATIESSVVGRKALHALDDMIGNSLKDEIQKLTGGKSSDLEGLFKWAAQTYARDRSEHDSLAIASIVDQIKDKMPSKGDLPPFIYDLVERLKGS